MLGFAQRHYQVSSYCYRKVGHNYDFFKYLNTKPRRCIYWTSTAWYFGKNYNYFISFWLSVFITEYLGVVATLITECHDLSVRWVFGGQYNFRSVCRVWWTAESLRNIYIFYGRLLFRFSVWDSSPNIMDKINPNPISNAHLQLVTHIYSRIWGIYIYQQTYFGSAGSTWDAKTIKIAYEGITLFIWSNCCLSVFAFRLRQRFTNNQNENTKPKWNKLIMINPNYQAVVVQYMHLRGFVFTYLKNLRQLAAYVTTDVLKKFYQGYILPLIDYGSIT